jgi:hypothetical protein
MSVKDVVKVENVTSTYNTNALGITSTFNGSFDVLSTPDSYTFTYKIVGVSAKSYRDTGEEIVTTKRVLVPYNETNEYIEWNKMYPPEEPILFGPCESTGNETINVTQTIDLIIAEVSLYDMVKAITSLLS